MADSEEVSVATRVSRAVYEKIVLRQKAAKRLTGIEPSVSAVVRAMIEEAAGNSRTSRVLQEAGKRR